MEDRQCIPHVNAEAGHHQEGVSGQQSSTRIKKKLEFRARDNQEYELKAIINSTVYSQEKKNDQMPGLYYLVSWKGFLDEKNTGEPSSAVIQLRMLISIFHKEHPKKPIATSLPLDSALPMAKPTILKEPKQKCGPPSKKTNKRGRNKSIVAPDLYFVLKLLIQQSRPYFQSASGFPPRVSSLGFGGFSPITKQQQMISFRPRFLIKFRRFFINRVLGFPSSFFHRV